MYGGRTEVNNSYLFVSKIGRIALSNYDFDLAEKWGLIGLQYKGIQGLLGEQEFFMDEVYFAKSDMDKANQYFEIAMQKGMIPYGEYLQKLYKLWKTIIFK